jgi:hypothetical protein
VGPIVGDADSEGDGLGEAAEGAGPGEIGELDGDADGTDDADACGTAEGNGLAARALPGTAAAHAAAANATRHFLSRIRFVLPMRAPTQGLRVGVRSNPRASSGF